MRCPTGTRLSSHKSVGVSHHPESGNPGQVGLRQGRLTPAESEAQWQARWQTCPSAGNSEWLLRERALARNARSISAADSHSQICRQGGGHQSSHTRVLSGTADLECSPVTLGLGQQDSTPWLTWRDEEEGLGAELLPGASLASNRAQRSWSLRGTAGPRPSSSKSLAPASPKVGGKAKVTFQENSHTRGLLLTMCRCPRHPNPSLSLPVSATSTSYRDFADGSGKSCKKKAGCGKAKERAAVLTPQSLVKEDQQGGQVIS